MPGPFFDGAENLQEERPDAPYRRPFAETGGLRRGSSSMIEACRGVLVEIGSQLFVELRMLFPDLPGLLEEGLG